MNRLKTAQYLAIVATVLSVVGFITTEKFESVSATCIALGFVLGMVSYIFGGFGTAVKMAVSIAKWGWIVVPFPTDILSGIFSFFFAIIVFIFFPIVPIRKAYKENMW